MLTQQSGVLRKKTCNRKSKANTIKEKGAEKDIKHVQLLLFIVKKFHSKKSVGHGVIYCKKIYVSQGHGHVSLRNDHLIT